MSRDKAQRQRSPTPPTAVATHLLCQPSLRAHLGVSALWGYTQGRPQSEKACSQWHQDELNLLTGRKRSGHPHAYPVSAGLVTSPEVPQTMAGSLLQRKASALASVREARSPSQVCSNQPGGCFRVKWNRVQCGPF